MYTHFLKVPISIHVEIISQVFTKKQVKNFNEFNEVTINTSNTIRLKIVKIQNSFLSIFVKTYVSAAHKSKKLASIFCNPVISRFIVFLRTTFTYLYFCQ